MRLPELALSCPELGPSSLPLLRETGRQTALGATAACDPKRPDTSRSVLFNGLCGAMSSDGP